jgi:hypothetical protein
MLQSGMREGGRDKPPIVLNVLKEGEAIIESLFYRTKCILASYGVNFGSLLLASPR